MFDWEQEYLRMKSEPSDLNEHLETLYNLAIDCGPGSNLCEFGVGFGKSTKAFIFALTKTLGALHSYDIKLHDGIQELFDNANNDGLAAVFHLQNTLEIDLPPIDISLLLIDSHHTYAQVKVELEKHSDRVKKYIAFHDTQLYGISGQDHGSVGIMPAINEWMDTHPQWRIKQEYYNNNGMLVVERV